MAKPAERIVLSAYEQHRRYINNYVLHYGKGQEYIDQLRSEPRRNDYDVLREQHRFVWNENDDKDMDWEKEMAKKYYDKLFKEFCLADLSRYKEKKIAMRWRLEAEVFEGKGQFSCGNIRCNDREKLRHWEVNFGYIEHGEKRNALVKLCLCKRCSKKLNHIRQHKEVKSEDAFLDSQPVDDEDEDANREGGSRETSDVDEEETTKKKKRKHKHKHKSKHKHKRARKSEDS